MTIRKLISDNEKLISKLSIFIKRRNSSYSLDTIKSMVITALWENKEKVIPRQLYLIVLNRITEEKGYKYNNNKLFNPITIDDNLNYYVEEKTPDYCRIVDDILSNLMYKGYMGEDEVFVLALKKRLNTPSCLSDDHKKILNELSPLYDAKPPTKKELSKISGIPSKRIEEIVVNINHALNSYKETVNKAVEKKEKNLRKTT